MPCSNRSRRDSIKNIRWHPTNQRKKSMKTFTVTLIIKTKDDINHVVDCIQDGMDGMEWPKEEGIQTIYIREGSKQITGEQ